MSIMSIMTLVWCL